MRRLLVSQLRHRRGRAAALGLAILVAAASFTLLTASARTSTLHVRRTLTRNFRGAYDILVRPKGSFTPLEREQGLVRDNYLSGIYGGITLRQYHTIERIPGVEVAAPIANVGYVLLPGEVPFRLDRFLGSGRDQLLRVRFDWRAQRGLSRFPGATVYVYYTRRPLGFSGGPRMYAKIVTPGGSAYPLLVCEGLGDSSPESPPRPFAPSPPALGCFSAHPSGALRAFAYRTGQAFGPDASVGFQVYFPLAVAAIDPVQEAKLLHLDRTVVAGRYLRAGDTASGRSVPLLASSRTYLDEQLAVRVVRLRAPAGVDVARALASGACTGHTFPCPAYEVIPGPPGRRKQTAYTFLTGLGGTTIADTRSPAASAYTAALTPSATTGPVRADAYWTSKPVRYRRLGRDTLAPITVTNPSGIWSDPLQGVYYQQPTDNLDTQLRSLDEHAVTNKTFQGGTLARLRVVGRFDPARLPGFSALSQLPLETYYPPRLSPVGRRSSDALHGRTLEPDQNIGGYLQQPPLGLTTLGGLRGFFRSYTVGRRERRAPISVIRVRCAGVSGPNALSEARIRTVAQLIHDRTGLDVDITAGSSPTPITIDLPAGKFGRPALELSEGWVKKGVAVSYLRALDRKDLALFALILVVCVLFLGNGAFAAVRVRRGEIGALLTLGWSPREIFVSVLGELALVGLAAGLVGTGLAAALVHWLALEFPLLRVLYVLPIAVGLALVAGLVPAWRAARGRPLDAVGPPVSGARRARHVRGIGGIALVNLARLPGRTLVGAAGLVLGVAALTVLVGIERGFSGTLVGTLLGSAISVQVRRADLVALALTLALSALSAADVLHLNLRERRGELVTLRTLGWSEAETRRLVALEALGLAAGASILGAAIGILVGALVLGVGLPALGVAAAIAGGGAALAALAASLLPVLRLHRFAAPEVLAAE